MSSTTDTMHGDRFTVTHGWDDLARRLTERYGQRYLDYRAAWKRSENYELLPFPANLELDLIDACTLRCPQCLRSADLAGEYAGYIGTGVQLPFDSILACLDEGREHDLPSVNIGGSGEPMLYPRFLDVCAAVMERGVMELRIISNGTLLSEEIARGLVEIGPQVLSISIDATDPETYGLVRGKPRMHAQVVANVLRFLELRRAAGRVFPLLRVTFVKQPANRHQVQPFLDFWLGRAEMVDVQVQHDFRRSEYHRDWTCTEPWRRLEVWADGHVGPCCGFPGIVFDFGRAGRDRLADIWRSPRLESLRRALQGGSYPLACLKCQGTRAELD